jgi:putative hydrolase of the HAD superfamily
MAKSHEITCLFVDIGGVLLTDGWDRHARKRAAATFELNWAETEERHLLTWDTYQAGKLRLEEYLNLTVFRQRRPFTRVQFRNFIFAQSRAFPRMIELITRLKAQHGLKVAVVSNEGRELNAYRIQKFKLNRFVDFFISSCFVHLLKPDLQIFQLALDIAQVPARQVVYIENTPLFVQTAEELGIRSILHTSFAATSAKLASFGLKSGKAVT